MPGKEQQMTNKQSNIKKKETYFTDNRTAKTEDRFDLIPILTGKVPPSVVVDAIELVHLTDVLFSTRTLTIINELLPSDLCICYRLHHP